MSMSLDGFVTAAGISPEEPLGVGRQRLHDWAYPDTAREAERCSNSPSSVRVRSSSDGPRTTRRWRGGAQRPDR
jgi:hypothetical protein